MAGETTNGNGRNQLAIWLGILVPGLTAAAIIVGLIWQLANVAFQVNAQAAMLAAFTSRADADRATLSKLRTDMERYNTALNEIETQFCEADHLRNLMHATDLRWMAMLWEKNFGQRIPTDNAYYPTVCNRVQK